MSKTFVYITSKEKLNNQSAIGYMVKPTLYMNKVFKEQVENCLKETFFSSTMSGIINFSNKDNTCFIALVILYYNRTTNPIKVFRMLSCVIYRVNSMIIYPGSRVSDFAGNSRAKNL